MKEGKLWFFMILSVASYLGNIPVYADINDATVSFSMELVQKILEQDTGNVIVSPLSVYALLAMLQNGAGGNTKHQLDQVLHADEQMTREGYHNLTRQYQQSNHLLEVDFASKAFLRTGFDVLPQYRELLVSDFLANIDSLDFTDTDAATQHINNWVAESTHNHITDLFQPGKIQHDSVMVLVNAVFFKSYWDHPFWRNNDMKPFFPNPNEELQVPTMYQQEFHHAGESSDLGIKWLHLNFESTNDYTLLLVLPNERHNLNALCQLTHENWKSIFSHQGYRRVHVYVPKFKLKKETQLIPLMRSLGVGDIFDDGADLSGITAQSIKVSHMLQKATIAVDETGVTASAATGAVAQPASLFYVPGAEDMEFKADQPFLVFIVDRVHGIPLFAGRVTNPLNE